MQQIQNHANYLHKSLTGSVNERGISLQDHEVEEKYVKHIEAEISALEKHKEKGKEKVSSIVTGESVDIDTEIGYLNAVLKAFPGVKSKDKPKVEKQSDVDGDNIEKKVINPTQKKK